jgi:hypothetical protein
MECCGSRTAATAALLLCLQLQIMFLATCFVCSYSWTLVHCQNAMLYPARLALHMSAASPPIDLDMTSKTRRWNL